MSDLAPPPDDPTPQKMIAAGVEKALRKNRPPMKDDRDFAQHNSKAYDVTAAELLQFVERFEQLGVEKQEVADKQKETMAEAKGRGYDTKVLRKLIALRKRKPDDVAEEEAIMEVYKAALGMA